MKDIYQENTKLDTESLWQIDRRKWLKLATAGIIASQIPWWISCSAESTSNEKTLILDGKDVLSSEEMECLYVIQNILVPADGNGPSASDIKAHDYFIWMLQDERLPQSEKDYFINKLQNLISLSNEKFGKKIHLLTEKEQALFIENNVLSGWTQTYLSRMITVIFEAMLLDPVYGVNPNEIGWEWLEHTPGNPRPNKDNLYPKIYNNIPVYG